MINILEKFFTKALSRVENFNDTNNMDNASKNIIPLLLAIVVTEILLLVIGKFLWNNYLVKAVTVVRPIDSVIELFAIAMLLRLLLN